MRIAGQLGNGVQRLVAAVGMVIAAPILLTIGIVIRLESPGPILFRQERTGRDGRPFTIVKFRTMQHGVADDLHREQNLRELADGGRLDGPVAYKDVRDPRITRAGRALRRLSLDELPQLWNVVRGDMALVGPRPSLPWETEEFPEWAAPRLSVRPGLTGVWQVSGRNEVSLLEMLEMDVEYARTRTPLGDLRILLKTIPAVLSSRGAA